MAWYDIGSALLLLVIAGAVAYGLFLGGRILWGAAEAWRDSRGPSEVAETASGRFEKLGGTWEGEVRTAQGRLHLNPADVDGKPNPEFLARVPEIVAELPRWTELAREQADLNAAYELESLTDGFPKADFVLGFGYYEEEWGESVYVTFAEGAVVSIMHVD